MSDHQSRAFPGRRAPTPRVTPSIQSGARTRPLSVLGEIHMRWIFSRRRRVLARWVASCLPAGATVLDVGCGDGSIARAIMGHRPDVSVSGVDVLLRPEVAIPAKLFDGHRLPYDDASVDAITVIDVLHHTDDPLTLLRECARVARSTVVVKDHTRDGWAAQQRLAFIDWVGNVSHGVRLPYNYWSRREWEDGFERAGLSEGRWITELGLYPPPANWVFGHGLQFIAELHPATPGLAPAGAE